MATTRAISAMCCPWYTAAATVSMIAALAPVLCREAASRATACLLYTSIALWLPNYILYFGVSILFNTGANLVVAARYQKDFPELHEVKVTLRDFKDLGIFHEMCIRDRCLTAATSK